jgi:cytidine deaminase
MRQMNYRELDDADHGLIAEAEALINQVSDGSLHTVACAMLATSGRVYRGVNVFAQGGGACAELVTLGMAASADEMSIQTVVAVGDGGRGVVVPCGVCRQLLVDYLPAASVVMPRDGQPAKVAVRDLLPDGPRSWFAKE